MELSKLKELVLSNQIPKFLIFFGEEHGVMKEYISKIKELTNLGVEESDSVLDYFTEMNNQSLLGSSGDAITIIRNDKKFLTQENLWGDVKQSRNPLILIYDTIDKRSRAYKQLEDSMVCFDRLEDDVMVSMIQYYQPQLTDASARWLMNAVGKDYTRCRTEMKKLDLFPDENKNVLLKEFADSGAIHSELPDCIFDFSNAVLDHNKKKSFELYEILKLIGEPNIRLLSVLYNSFRNQVLVQLSNNPTTEATGLSPYLIKLARGRYRCYSNIKLVEALKAIQYVDTAVKMGTLAEDICVDYLLVKLFG